MYHNNQSVGEFMRDIDRVKIFTCSGLMAFSGHVANFSISFGGNLIQIQ